MRNDAIPVTNEDIGREKNEAFQPKSEFKNQPGFTMMELVITLAVLSILFFLVIRPSISSSSTTTLTASARQLRGDLLSMRTRAMENQLLERLVFTIGSGTYSLYEQSSTNNVWNLMGNNLPLPTGILISASTLPNTQIIYDKNGVPYEDVQSDLPSQVNLLCSQNRTITLQLPNQGSVDLTLIPETGYVQKP